MADTRIVVTFGSDHTHPVSGRKLGRHYVVITGDSYEDCRRQTVERFGTRWAFDYMDYPGGSTGEGQAGVERFGLTEVDIDTGEPVA